ncbi:hypothetical protein AB0J55_17300 [Amycolatopsis sp. NPDC049688]|uniref:hypothetical protein n=1 Tax=Amycolatopsis sp. NPDC049688 TaxID=3154733 RepID=UPI003421F362
MAADGLDALRFADAADRRAGLLSLRPPDAGANWWLGVIEHVTLQATGPGTPEAERRAWAELAVAALAAALGTGGLDDREVATREARLCLALPAADRPDRLRPDRVARNCLALVGSSPAEVAASRWSLRAEDVPVLRKLRRVRNLVVPALDLSAQVEDEELRRELAEWREIVPALP